MPRTTVRDLAARVDADEPITMLTAYDAPTARLVDEADVDVILVGDSVGNTQLGHDDTLPVTMEQMLSHTAAVVRGTEEAMVVADMPFLSYGASTEAGVENAGRFLKEAGAGAVKLETAPDGDTTISFVERLVELGVPVMGHLGHTPQRLHEIGWGVVQGRGGAESTYADELVATARRLADAGAFSLVLELVAEPVARRVTEAVDVPVIGIGAGRYVDGQVLVVNDVVGLPGGDFKIAKQYGDVEGEIRDAVQAYAEDVRNGEFPARENAFEPIDDE